ncbi:MAG: Kdo domain containing protein, partial [Flavobacteriaceae bacterium]|nr:Kdo domain containing protein [Flavobacteriaceae bacterium]
MNHKEHKVFSEDQDIASIKIISGLVKSFDDLDGGEGERNTIKNVTVQNLDLNIKSFKVPHLVNRIAYSFFRKSKANRSFDYANDLIKKGIKTPKPFAYFEYSNLKLLHKSFYVSEQLSYDLTYRELITGLNYPDYDNILREFTRFTFDLHEKGVNFLDHSPGNTLIKKNKNTGKYDFYLVDLNRMNFHAM